MRSAARRAEQATRPGGGVGDQKIAPSTGGGGPDHAAGPCTFFHRDMTITIVRNTALVERDGVPVDDDEADRAIREAFACP